MRRRWGWTALLALAVLFGLSGWYYHSIQRDKWKQDHQAVSKAKNETDLEEATKVQLFDGGSSYRIVYGKDEDGRAMMVWVGNDEVHEEYVEDGMTADELKKSLSRQDPDMSIKRIVPGKYDEDYIWEVYYCKKESGGKRYYLGYYSFYNGSWVDTYRLAKD